MQEKKMIVKMIKEKYQNQLNIVRTRTEHSEPEHLVCVQVHWAPEPNLEVHVQVRAHDPRTRTEPNPGQSNLDQFICSWAYFEGFFKG